MKKLSILLLLILIFTLSACQSEATENTNSTEPIQTENETNELLSLTLTELSAFDGKEGRRAYIAVNGNIYDVTDSSLWRSGNHNGFSAGQDLTDEIMNQSPHGLSTLSGVPLIGMLVDSE